jgi:hypothetical protein
MDALSIILLTQATRTEARSALPDAPVVPPDEPRPRRHLHLRRTIATALYHLAQRLEPQVASVAH